MATRRLKENFDVVGEWFALARKRVEIPQDWFETDYDDEADVLYIKIIDSPATYSDDDLDNEIVFDYDKNNRLVGIEVLNLYGIYAEV